jgi:hypothetical protein
LLLFANGRLIGLALLAVHATADPSSHFCCTAGGRSRRNLTSIVAGATTVVPTGERPALTIPTGPVITTRTIVTAGTVITTRSVITSGERPALTITTGTIVTARTVIPPWSVIATGKRLALTITTWSVITTRPVITTRSVITTGKRLALTITTRSVITTGKRLALTITTWSIVTTGERLTFAVTTRSVITTGKRLTLTITSGTVITARCAITLPGSAASTRCSAGAAAARTGLAAGRAAWTSTRTRTARRATFVVFVSARHGPTTLTAIECIRGECSTFLAHRKMQYERHSGSGRRTLRTARHRRAADANNASTFALRRVATISSASTSVIP